MHLTAVDRQTADRPAATDFHCCAANHFATIGRSFGMARRDTLNDAVQASTCTTAPGSVFQTGTRKIYAKEGAFADTMQVHRKVWNVEMTPGTENIHATDAKSATVAPILHRWIRVLPNRRGTTHNQGAADADGR